MTNAASARRRDGARGEAGDRDQRALADREPAAGRTRRGLGQPEDGRAGFGRAGGRLGGPGGFRRRRTRRAGRQRGHTVCEDMNAAAQQRFGGHQQGAQDFRDQLAGERAGAAPVDLFADEDEEAGERGVRVIEAGGDRGAFFGGERVRLHAAQYGMGLEGVAPIWVIFV